MYNRFCLTLLGFLSLGLVLGSKVQAATLIANLGAINAADTLHSSVVVLFEPPTDEKVDNSRGGASRPADVKCIQDKAYSSPLTALMPQSGVGLTVASRPTLLVYVPVTTATQVHLTMRDATQGEVYQGWLPIPQIPQTGGIVSLTLPTDSPELTVGETYHWSLALLCQPAQTDLPIISGQIRRVERSEDMANEPHQSLLRQAVVYGQLGVWHDMLTSLSTLRQTQPDNHAVEANWFELLQVENLGAIATMPLLN